MGPYYYRLSEDRRYQTMMQGWNEANVVAMAERIASFRQAAGAGLAAFAAPLLWLARRRQQARTMRQLAALDDRMLSDIGLSRAAIRDAARRPQLFRRPLEAQRGADIVLLSEHPAPVSGWQVRDAMVCGDGEGGRSAA